LKRLRGEGVMSLREEKKWRRGERGNFGSSKEEDG
jgi:hypothetical protein